MLEGCWCLWLDVEKSNAESRACQVPLQRAGIRLWAGSAVSPSAQVLGCPWGRRAKEAHRQHRLAGCQLQRRQGAGGSPSSALVHAPIVPTNNGRDDKRALELMTQTQVWGAAGWLLKGSTVCAVATAPALPVLPGPEPGLLTVSSLNVE